MNAQTKIEAVTMRTPFPAHQISKLPKPTKAQNEAIKADYRKGIRCPICEGWHHPDVIHLDYVGHAALTDRLLDVDPDWSWEPFARGEDGLPLFDKTGGLWINLTINGKTRPGYGHAAAKPNADPGAREKECIGDALRNAAMRFGAALDLWHKGDLHLDEDAGGQSNGAQSAHGEPAHSTEMSDAEWARLVQLVEASKANGPALLKHYGLKDLRAMTQDQYADCIAKLTEKLAKAAKAETDAKASTLAEELKDEIQF